MKESLFHASSGEQASHHEIRAGAVVRVWWTPSMLRIGSNQAAARGSGRFERGTVMRCDPPELARRRNRPTSRMRVNGVSSQLHP